MTSKTALSSPPRLRSRLVSFEMRPAAGGAGRRARDRRSRTAAPMNSARSASAGAARRSSGRPARGLRCDGRHHRRGIAAASDEREYYYERPYHGPGYGYYGGAPAYQYAQPQPYVRHHYAQPQVVQHRIMRRTTVFIPTRSSAGRCRGSQGICRPTRRIAAPTEGACEPLTDRRRGTKAATVALRVPRPAGNPGGQMLGVGRLFC